MTACKLSEDYKCAPEGHTVKAFKKGETITGKAAELALADKAGTEVKEKAPAKPKETPKPKTTKPKAGPKNKG